MDHFVLRDSSLGQYITSDGVIAEANDAFCRILKCAPGYVVGRPVTDFLLPEDHDYLSRGETQLEVHYHSGELDAPVLAMASVTPIVTGVPSNSLVLTQVQDLSAKEKLERDLRRNATDLEQFAYIASHDLREPLMTMAAYASLIQRKCGNGLSADGMQFLQEILDASCRMERKIDDLLAFSRAGRDVPMPGFRLATVFKSVTRMLGHKIAETHADVTMGGPDPHLKGNPDLIGQVIQNLVLNGIKYRGKQWPKIEVGATPAGPCCWTISVKDNGLGFPMEHHDKIFGVFTRLYTQEEYPGTGIGLAIAKKIVQRHGGKLWAESTPGQGSTFFFTLQAIDHDHPNTACGG